MIYFLYRKHTPVLKVTDRYLTAGTRGYWYLDDITDATFEDLRSRRVMVLKNKKGEVWNFSFDEKICENLGEAKREILEILPEGHPVSLLVKQK